MNPTWLSVVVPVYNGSPFLERALFGIEQQDLANVEVIILDDGSTDGSQEIVRRFQGRIPIQFHQLSRTGNWVQVTNVGMNQAKGEWLSFLHQDDLWRPNRIVRLREAAQRSPEVDFFVHDVRFVNAHGRDVGAYSVPWPPAKILAPGEMVPGLLIQNTVAISGVMFRTPLAHEIGALDDRHLFTADWKFWLELALRGRSMRLAEPLGEFRVHAASQTSQLSLDPVGLFREYREVQEEMTARLPEIGRDYLSAGMVSAGLNGILAALRNRKLGSIRAILAQCWLPTPWALALFCQHSRFGQRTFSRIRS